MTIQLKNEIKTNKRPVELRYINERDLEFFKEILTAETIGGHEYLIKDTLMEKLKNLGFEMEIDSLGNIAAVRGNSDEYVMLNAHMDIVDYSWSYSSYNSYKDSYYYNNSYNYMNLCNYDNDYEFYEEMYEKINSIKEKHTSKSQYHKEVIEELKPLLKNLSELDLEGMGCDCIYCTKQCKGIYICEKFNLDTTIDSNLEYFLDLLETYCIQAMDEIDMIRQEADYLDEEEEEIEEVTKSEPDYEVVIDLIADKIKGKGKSRVLGGDDKCGIFIALKVAELLPTLPLKILFTVREESGCVGVSHFIDENVAFFDNVKYSLTIDRRDNDNLLWSQLGTRSCSDDFAGRLAREGVKEGIRVRLMDGSVADVIHIRNLVPNSVNMSAGYYNAHTSDEYIVPSDVDRIIGWVKNILLNV